MITCTRYFGGVHEPDSGRPRLTAELTSSEFLRWYWLKDELSDFARDLGIRAADGKVLLTQRISARLDGGQFVEPSALKKSLSPQLSGALTSSTRIPAGQRCSQVVRAWLESELGPSFHFDAEMRSFFAETDGSQTLADALENWHRTRSTDRKSIDGQFEYNRFTRAWHDTHPNGSKNELLESWREYRRVPIDERGKA